MIAGRATPEGTAAYAAAHPSHHFRAVGGLQLSTVGHGSYLGDSSEDARTAYRAAMLACLQGGINVIDTASNYRDQASERDVGAAIAAYLEAGGSREHLLVASKAGFLHGDADSGMRGPDWFQQEYVLDGTVGRRDIIGNMHCMTPQYIDRELQRSRSNLGLETVDVYFLHNPELQLAEGIADGDWLRRMRDAFELLERRADDGHIKVYGIATWDGLRIPPGQPGHIPLVKLIHEAGQAAIAQGRKAAQHRFRALEFPLNMAMPEAVTLTSQAWKFAEQTVTQCAQDTGMLSFASASLMQARLDGNVPAEWRQALGTESDLETALQFTRSQAITTALVGMGRPEHAQEVLRWAQRAPDAATVRTMMGSGWGHD